VKIGSDVKHLGISTNYLCRVIKESLIDKRFIRRALRYTDSISRSQLEANDENYAHSLARQTGRTNAGLANQLNEWQQWDANISLFGYLLPQSRLVCGYVVSYGTLVADLQRLSTK